MSQGPLFRILLAAAFLFPLYSRAGSITTPTILASTTVAALSCRVPRYVGRASH